MSSSQSYRAERRIFGPVESVGSAGVFGQVMGLVAITMLVAAGLFLGLGVGGRVTGGCACEPRPSGVPRRPPVADRFGPREADAPRGRKTRESEGK